MREQPRGCTGVQLVPDTLCVWGSRFWTAPAWAKGHLRSVYVLSLLRGGCRLTHPVPQRASSPLCPEWAEGTLQWGAEHRSLPIGRCPSSSTQVLQGAIRVRTGSATCSLVPLPCTPSRQPGLSDHPQEVAHVCVKRPVRKARLVSGPRGRPLGAVPSPGPRPTPHRPGAFRHAGALGPLSDDAKGRLSSSTLASLSVGCGAPPCPTLAHSQPSPRPST